MHKKLKSLLSIVISGRAWTSVWSGFLLCTVYVALNLHFNHSQREIKLCLWLRALEIQDVLTSQHFRPFVFVFEFLFDYHSWVAASFKRWKPMPTSVVNRSLVEPEPGPAISIPSFPLKQVYHLRDLNAWITIENNLTRLNINYLKQRTTRGENESIWVVNTEFSLL